MNRPADSSLHPALHIAGLVVVATIAFASCGTAGSPPASPTPALPTDGGQTPAPTAATGGIEHATGATDVVFRFDEGGGFVPMGFFATEAPIFTLYGDGTVIFKDITAGLPPSNDAIIRMPAFETARLNEDEIQAFLRYAIADGGIGVAQGTYGSVGADLPTATFTINAGGTMKVVSVMALGMDRGDGTDTLVLKALAGLGEKLRSFGPEVDGETAWVPGHWRGVLTPDSLNPPIAWPWPSIKPADFVQHQEPDAPQFPVRTMTPDEIAVLGLSGIEGGFSGLSLTGPDGKAYFFALRPLFPDEQF